MRILRFVRAQTMGAFDPASFEKKAPAVVAAVKAMSKRTILRVLSSKDFVPLDFIALIYHFNRDAFADAMKDMIKRQLSSRKHQDWLKEMNLPIDDAASEIYREILNNDPMRRGILNQLILDGSRSHKYNYESKGYPERKRALRESLQPNEHDLVVPFCPFCEQVGLKKPVWTIEVGSGTLKMKNHLPGDRCDTLERVTAESIPVEPAGIIRQQPGIYTVSNGQVSFRVQLTDKQDPLVEEGLRNFEIINNTPILRCTFEADIPSFSAYMLMQGTLKEVSDLWKKFREAHGRTITPAEYKRLQELQSKESAKTMTLEEKREYEKLQERIQTKQKDFVGKPVSLDTPTSSGDGEGPSRHETLSKEEGQDFIGASVKEVEAAKFELLNVLDEEDIELVQDLKPTGNGLIQALQLLMQQRKKEYWNRLLAVAQLHLYGPEEKDSNTCRTCGSVESPVANICSYALKMQKDIYAAYMNSKNVAAFNSHIAMLDQNTRSHVTKSNASKYITPLFNRMEVTEDDIFSLSFEEDNDSDTLSLSLSDFKSKLEPQLTPEEKQHYFGTNIGKTATPETPTEEPNSEVIEELAENLDQLIRTVVRKDLSRELVMVFYS